MIPLNKICTIQHNFEFVNLPRQGGIHIITVANCRNCGVSKVVFDTRSITKADP